MGALRLIGNAQAFRVGHVGLSFHDNSTCVAVPNQMVQRWVAGLAERRRRRAIRYNDGIANRTHASLGQNQGMHGSGNTRVQNSGSTPRPVIPTVIRLVRIQTTPLQMTDV